jgi:DNA-binding HxlR family transcriptional regulator
MLHANLWEGLPYPERPTGGAGVLEERTTSQRPMPARRQWTPLARALTAAGDNWTLMIAVELAPGRTRLSELRERLADVSAGVLDRYLQRMISSGLITRTRFREMPPRVELELTDAGRELLPIAASMARWGRKHAWSDPLEGEQVDVGALVDLLPSMLEHRVQAPDSIVELSLLSDSGDCTHRLQVRDGRIEATADEDVAPAVRIVGRRAAWVRTLGPTCKSDQLELDGDEQLGRAVLDALAG